MGGGGDGASSLAGSITSGRFDDRVESPQGERWNRLKVQGRGGSCTWSRCPGSGHPAAAAGSGHGAGHVGGGCMRARGGEAKGTLSGPAAASSQPPVRYRRAGSGHGRERCDGGCGNAFPPLKSSGNCIQMRLVLNPSPAHPISAPVVLPYRSLSSGARAWWRAYGGYGCRRCACTTRPGRT